MDVNIMWEKVKELATGTLVGVFGIAWILSVPVGVITGVVRDDTLAVVLSFFVPLYGSLYAVFGG